MENWISRIDSTGRLYYINPVTGNTSYVRVDSISHSKPHPLYQISTKPNELLGLTSDALESCSRITRGLQSAPAGDLAARLSEWNNPVFSFAAPNAVCVESTLLKSAQGLRGFRFNKAMLSSMKILCQIDQKFIACILSVSNNIRDASIAVGFDDKSLGDDDKTIIGQSERLSQRKVVSENSGNLLILIDQHAAHERIRLEEATKDLYHPTTADDKENNRRRIRRTPLSPTLKLNLSAEEIRCVVANRKHLLTAGIVFTISETNSQTVIIHTIPSCLVTSHGRNRTDLLVEFVAEIIRLMLNTGSSGCVTVPDILHQALCSHACHGAIKFGDKLTREKCVRLVQELSTCELPFQCAHGRPSIVPLVDLESPKIALKIGLSSKLSSLKHLRDVKSHLQFFK